MFDAGLSDLMASAHQMVLDDNRRMAQHIGTPAPLREGEMSQMRSEEVLREFFQRYEDDLKEQAKENEENRKLATRSYKVSIVATIIGGASLVVAVIASVLPLLR